MDDLLMSILKTLAYFDIFDYPLTSNEIIFFLDIPILKNTIEPELKLLTQEELLFQFDGYYSLRNDETLATKRITETETAVKLLKIARKIAVLLSYFPYVKAVAVSGSLSKNVANEKGDIDFFIITAVNRLWIAKFFLLVFYKLAATLGFGKWFCLNYMIDEAALEIGENNIFTAIEITTLLPFRGAHIFKRFFETNKWVYDFLPNHSVRINNAIEFKPVFARTTIEWILNNKLGDKADRFIMRSLKKRWKELRLKNKITANGFLIGSMMVDKHFCKPFPQHFQQRILNKYQEKIELIKINIFFQPEKI